jgi:hypothetical protein
MSTLTRHGSQGPASERVRAIQRSRRAEAGSVTEMARLLLREAREVQDTPGARPSGESQAGRARGVAMRAGVPARRRSSPGLTKRPLAAGRA